MRIFFKRGVTITEILLVLSIIGILVIITLPKFSNIKEMQVLKNSTSDIVSAARTAQSQSLASLNSMEYGIHFQSDRVIIFTGQNFSATDSNNVIVQIISPASISNVTLNGTSGSEGDIYFQRLSGAPSKTGTITVTNSSSSKTITVSSSGAISIN